MEQNRKDVEQLFEEHPWLEPEDLQRQLVRISGEATHLALRRKKFIRIVDQAKLALEPYVACRSGCSHCCSMITVIYEHEAIRLAEVSGRQMTRLRFRPLSTVMANAQRFHGKPCPFLVDDKCSVYEDRPLVCRSHNSMNDNPADCDVTVPEEFRPPVSRYDPDIFEMPYMGMNLTHKPREPWGAICEFFPPERQKATP